MRGATQCAKRLKNVFAELRSKLGKVEPPPAMDPISHLILGVLSRNVPEAKAREIFDGVRAVVVDYNELRVIPVLELAAMLEGLPNDRTKAEDLSRSLNRIFAREHDVTLEPLRSLNRKEVKDYLEEIDGLEAYTRARIRLLGFEQHAVPLDEAMWAYARRSGIVDEKCPLDEAQAFLERQIAAADSLEFYTLCKQAAWAELGEAVESGEVERIESVPPDRSSQHMLRAIIGADEPEPAETPAAQTPAAEGAGSKSAGAESGGKKTAPKRATRKKAAAEKSEKKAPAKKSTKAAGKSKDKPKAKAKAKSRAKAKAKTKRATTGGKTDASAGKTRKKSAAKKSGSTGGSGRGKTARKRRSTPKSA